jgi:hypothetical protein
VVSPFNYTQLIGSAILGYAVFNESPDFWTWIGAAVIIASASTSATASGCATGKGSSRGLPDVLTPEAGPVGDPSRRPNVGTTFDQMTKN